MPRKVLINIPPSMLEQVDFIAQVEHRTRSDLIREAIRRYVLDFTARQRTAGSLSATRMSAEEVSNVNNS